MEKRTVIIYMPNGNEAKITTSQDVSHTGEYRLVDKIECQENRVNVAWLEDGKPQAEAYVMMPYILEIW